MILINEKYNELLQTIAMIIAEKNEEIENLQDEIRDLKNQIEEAEKEGI